MNQDNRQDPRMNDPWNQQGEGIADPYFAPQTGEPYWQGEEPSQAYEVHDQVPFQPVQDHYQDPRMQQQPPNWQQQGGYPQQGYGDPNPQYGNSNQPYGGKQPPYQQQQYGHPQYPQHPPRGARPGQRPPRRPMGNPLLMTQTINDFKELFNGYISAQPLNAFKFDLSLLTWPILLFANILLYALTKATAVYMSAKSGLSGALADLGSLLGESAGTTVKPPWGMPFLYALLEQILVLGVIVGMGFLIAYMTRSEQRPPLQFVKTLAVATIPHTVLHFVFLFLGIGLPKPVMFLSIMATFFLIFTYYNGFSKLHPSKRSSYWWFLLTFLLVAIILYLMPYSLPKLSLI